MPASHHRSLAILAAALFALPAAHAEHHATETSRSMSSARTPSPISPACMPVARRALSDCYQPPATGPIPVAFFDADSTLRVSKSGNVSANHPEDVILLPGVAEKLRKVAAEGFLIAIASNQGGVAAGFVKLEDADGALRYTIELLAAQGAPVHYYDFAEARDEYRKPKGGMAWELERLLADEYRAEVDWAKSYMVGDSGWKKGKDTEPFGTPGSDFSNSDRGFAETVRKARGLIRGFPFYHPRDFFGWTKWGLRGFRNRNDLEAFQKSRR